MSTDYNLNALQIIDSALRVLGVIPSGASAATDPTMLANCLQALNLLIKNYQNYGPEQWTTQTHTIANLTTGKANYSFGANCDITTQSVPERVLQAWVSPSTGIDVETAVIGMSEYWGLANKNATGQPNQVAYLFQNQVGNLYVWPVAADSTYAMTVIFQRPYNDLDANTDFTDFPQRWLEALKWNLCLRLAPEYGRQVSPEIVALATSTLQAAIEDGYESGSISFSPKWRP